MPMYFIETALNKHTLYSAATLSLCFQNHSAQIPEAQATRSIGGSLQGKVEDYLEASPPLLIRSLVLSTAEAI